MFNKQFSLLIMKICKLLFAKKNIEIYEVIHSDMFPPVPSCLLNIQQSPHCLASLNKEEKKTKVALKCKTQRQIRNHERKS